jgi:hypothetical protein
LFFRELGGNSFKDLNAKALPLTLRKLYVVGMREGGKGRKDEEFGGKRREEERRGGKKKHGTS